MSTKELHQKYWYLMEASINAKMSTLELLDISFAGIAAVEYYAPEPGLPDEAAYNTITFDYLGQPLAGKNSVLEHVENVNAVSIYLRLPSGKTVESGFIQLEKMFTGYGRWFSELKTCVESFGSREISSVALPF